VRDRLRVAGVYIFYLFIETENEAARRALVPGCKLRKQVAFLSLCVECG